MSIIALMIFGILGKEILFRPQFNPLVLAKVTLSNAVGGIKILINVLKNVTMLAKDTDNGVKEVPPGSHDNQLGQDLWEDYQSKRRRVKTIVKETIMQMWVELSIKITK